MFGVAFPRLVKIRRIGLRDVPPNGQCLASRFACAWKSDALDYAIPDRMVDDWDSRSIEVQSISNTIVARP